MEFNMTSQEATILVAGCLFAAAVVFGAIGAAADENKQKELAGVMLALAGALFGMSVIGFGKWILMFFIN